MRQRSVVNSPVVGPGIPYHWPDATAVATALQPPASRFIVYSRAVLLALSILEIALAVLTIRVAHTTSYVSSIGSVPARFYWAGLVALGTMAHAAQTLLRSREQPSEASTARREPYSILYQSVLPLFTVLWLGVVIWLGESLYDYHLAPHSKFCFREDGRTACTLIKGMRANAALLFMLHLGFAISDRAPVTSLAPIIRT